MTEDKIMELLEKVTHIGTKVDSMETTMNDMNARLTKLEQIKASDVEQNLKIEQLQKDINHGSEKMKTLEKRVETLEKADGEKAKDVWKVIGGIALTLTVGAILSHLGDILQWLVK